MQLDDMILLSIDDHSVEPWDMYKNHVPAKYRDLAPKVVRSAEGIDQWHFQGQATSTPFGMTATVGWQARIELVDGVTDTVDFYRGDPWYLSST